jgi:serine/threonine-protein kinase RsbT
MRTSADVDQARREAGILAQVQGFGSVDTECVRLAVSELALNLVRYAQQGEIVLAPVQGSNGAGVQIESHDAGPGIADLDRALEDDTSSGGGLGSGLPGARRLMDEFEISSGTSGTRITARKWSTGR